MTDTRTVRRAALRSCRYLLVLTLLASAINLAMAATALAVPVPSVGTTAEHGPAPTAAVDGVHDGQASQSPDGHETRIVKKTKGFVVSTPPQRLAPLAMPPALHTAPFPAGAIVPSTATDGAGNRRGPPGTAGFHASDS